MVPELINIIVDETRVNEKLYCEPYSSTISGYTYAGKYGGNPGIILST